MENIDLNTMIELFIFYEVQIEDVIIDFYPQFITLKLTIYLVPSRYISIPSVGFF